MKCKCGEEIVYVHEWLGAYDGWLAYQCPVCGLRHRVNEEEILELKQPKEYGPVYFKTENTYFRNLKEIEKGVYQNDT